MRGYARDLGIEPLETRIAPSALVSGVASVYNTSNGPVSVLLREGHGDCSLDGNGQLDITLEGTSSGSSLDINGSAVIDDMTAGYLGALRAPGTDLAGEMRVTGVQKLQIDDMLPGSHLFYGTASQTKAIAARGIYIDELDGTADISAPVIRAVIGSIGEGGVLHADRFVSTLSVSGNVEGCIELAASPRTVRVGGNMDGASLQTAENVTRPGSLDVSGSVMNSDISGAFRSYSFGGILYGSNVSTGPSTNTMKVRYDMIDSNIESLIPNSTLGSVKIGGRMENSGIYVLFDPGAGGVYGVEGNSLVDGRQRIPLSVKITGVFDGSYVVAKSIGKFSAGSADPDNGGVDFGVFSLNTISPKRTSIGGHRYAGPEGDFSVGPIVIVPTEPPVRPDPTDPPF